VHEEILRSAAKLFADRGVRGVSIDEVANGLGYTKSSVYYYFKSKGELLWAVFGYISGHFVGEAERIAKTVPDPLARFTELVRMHVRFLAEHKEWATVFYRDVSALPLERQAEVRGIIVRYDAFFRQAVQEGVESGCMQPLPPDIVVNAVLGACNWLVNWISPRHRESVDEITDTYVRLFTGGLALGDRAGGELVWREAKSSSGSKLDAD
jgi:AcrR family transcriptional regulator